MRYKIIKSPIHGQKSTDLLSLFRKYFRPMGFRRPLSFRIPISIFSQFTEIYNQSNFKFEGDGLHIYGSKKYLTQLVKDNDFLLSFMSRLLARFEIGIPYVIRSDALSDGGGIGIYDSKLFIRSGNAEDDLDMLIAIFYHIYDGEFSSNAVIYREKFNKSIGMGLLINPFECCTHNVEDVDILAPLYSGIAYTSKSGTPYVRIGMYMSGQDKGTAFTYWLGNDGEFVDGLESEGNHLVGIDADCVSSFDPFSVFDESNMYYSNKIGNMLYENEDSIRDYARKFLGWIKDVRNTSGRDFYLEWATNSPEEMPVIVQVSEWKDTAFVGTDMSAPKFYDEHHSTADVISLGRVAGTKVYFVDELNDDLIRFNANNSGYLLIVPMRFVSSTARNDLIQYQHLSNAAAVLEIQHRGGGVDHTSGVGNEHMQQLLEQSNILFVGMPRDKSTVWLNDVNKEGNSLFDVNWYLDCREVNEDDEEIKIGYFSERVAPYRGDLYFY